MSTRILPTERLHQTVATLARRGGAPLEPSERNELEPLLAKALIGPIALEEYLTALTEVLREPTGSSSADELEPWSVDGLIRAGLPALSSNEITLLARSPETIRTLHQQVCRAMEEGSAGEYWFDALDMPEGSIPDDYLPHSSIARVTHLLDEIEGVDHALRAAQDAAKNVLSPRTWPRSRIALTAVAMAASILIGVGLGWMLRAPDEELHASIQPTQWRTVRGDRVPVIEVRNDGSRPLFVTVVGLAPDSPPRVFHRDANQYIAVSPGSTRTVENFDEQLKGARAYLVVVTETPSGDVVREFLPQDAGPETANRLREELTKTLQGLGYRSFRVEVLTPP